MNLLEHYIIEVHQVVVPEDFPYMIKADLTCDCYGAVARSWHTIFKEDWEKILEQGYFLA